MARFKFKKAIYTLIILFSSLLMVYGNPLFSASATANPPLEEEQIAAGGHGGGGHGGHGGGHMGHGHMGHSGFRGGHRGGGRFNGRGFHHGFHQGFHHGFHHGFNRGFDRDFNRGFDRGFGPWWWGGGGWWGDWGGWDNGNDNENYAPQNQPPMIFYFGGDNSQSPGNQYYEPGPPYSLEQYYEPVTP